MASGVLVEESIEFQHVAFENHDQLAIRNEVFDFPRGNDSVAIHTGAGGKAAGVQKCWVGTGEIGKAEEGDRSLRGN